MSKKDIPFEPGARVIAYGRDSGGTDQEISILQQEATLRAWCSEHGLQLVRIFSDAARPGNTTAGRDQFLEMVEQLIPPKHQVGPSARKRIDVQGVLLWSYSRFARSFDDTAFYLATLRRAGYVVHSITDAIPDTLDGRLFESVLAWKDARARIDLSRDVKRGKLYMVSVHKAWSGGRAPVGYRLERATAGNHRDGSPREISRLVPDTGVNTPGRISLSLADQVRRAYELRSQGASLREILTEYPSLAGSVVRLGKVLHNRIYTGDYEYSGQIIKDYCIPIVDRALWIAAQRVNTERSSRFGYNHPRALRSQFILTGLIRCARCGMPMTGRVTQNRKRSPKAPDRLTGVGRPGNYKKYTYYRCQSQTHRGAPCGAALIPKDQVESQVKERLVTAILQPQVLADLRTRALQNTDPGDLQRRQESIADQLDDNHRRITRIVAAIEAGGHSAALLKNLSELEEKGEEIQQKALQLELEIADQARFDISDLDLDQLAAEARRLLEHGTDREKATVLRGFVRSLSAEIIGGKIHGEIEYKLPGIDQSSSVSL